MLPKRCQRVSIRTATCLSRIEFVCQIVCTSNREITIFVTHPYSLVLLCTWTNCHATNIFLLFFSKYLPHKWDIPPLQVQVYYVTYPSFRIQPINRGLDGICCWRWQPFITPDFYSSPIPHSPNHPFIKQKFSVPYATPHI
jgi:hypothetical protein